MTTEKIEQSKIARETEKVKKIQNYNTMTEANFVSPHREEVKSDSQDKVEQQIKENLAKFYLKKTKADMEKMQKPQISLQQRQEKAKLRRDQLNQMKIQKAKDLYEKVSPIDQIKQQSYKDKKPVAWIVCKDEDESLPLIKEFDSQFNFEKSYD